MKKYLCSLIFIIIAILMCSCGNLDDKVYDFEINEETCMMRVTFNKLDGYEHYKLKVLNTEEEVLNYAYKDGKISFNVLNLEDEEYNLMLYKSVDDVTFDVSLEVKVNLLNKIKDTTSNLGVKVYLKKGIITVVKLEADIKKYTLKEDYDFFNVTMRRSSDSNYVFLDGVVKEGYKFHDNLVIYVNNELKTTNITKSKESFTIRLNDENWTAFY